MKAKMAMPQKLESSLYYFCTLMEVFIICMAKIILCADELQTKIFRFLMIFPQASLFFSPQCNPFSPGDFFCPNINK